MKFKKKSGFVPCFRKQMIRERRKWPSRSTKGTHQRTLVGFPHLHWRWGNPHFCRVPLCRWLSGQQGNPTAKQGCPKHNIMWKWHHVGDIVQGMLCFGQNSMVFYHRVFSKVRASPCSIPNMMSLCQECYLVMSLLWSRALPQSQRYFSRPTLEQQGHLVTLITSR